MHPSLLLLLAQRVRADVPTASGPKMSAVALVQRVKPLLDGSAPARTGGDEDGSLVRALCLFCCSPDSAS